MGGGVFHINVPRKDIHVVAMGTAIPGYMGMNTPLNFQLEGNNAAINGDFILHPGLRSIPLSRPCGPMASRLLRSITICWTKSLGYFSCISGRMATLWT